MNHFVNRYYLAVFPENGKYGTGKNDQCTGNGNQGIMFMADPGGARYG